jgi:23S rRNA G2445 N2-methylase RlmL
VTRVHDPTADQWRFLVTTNRGLEPIATRELRELGASDLSTLYPGMIECAGTESMVPRLHDRGRTVHRLSLELGRGECSTLAEIAALIDDLDTPRYLGPEQSFAVRAQRRGDQPFTSPDVEETVGQAIVDAYRRAERTRPPVNLDDPDLIVRVFVRQQRVIVTIDTTGQHSLHRRSYRAVEHEAPIRPTMAAAMYRLAECRPGDRIVDPMCGCGTIPIETAGTALGWPPEMESAPAFEQFQFLESRLERERRGPEDLSLDIVGRDIDEQAIEGARENARHAGLDDALDFETADIRTEPLDADIVMTDMPFGIRTGGDVRPLYRAFTDRLAASDCRRAVVHTAREDLLGIAPTERIEMRRGRLETVMLVIE